MKITEYINQSYHGTEDRKWIENNRFVLEQARVFGLAVAGSLGIGLGKRGFVRKPGDLDFVCPSFSDAQAFIAALERKLTEYNAHWRVGVNHQNEHCPPGAITHFRFTTAMWMPICVMVVPVENFRFWLAPGGLRVQLFNIARSAQEATQAIDGKEREEVPPEVDKAAVTHVTGPLGPGELDMLREDDYDTWDPLDGGKWDVTGFIPPTIPKPYEKD